MEVNEPEDVSVPQLITYSTPQLSMTWSMSFSGHAAVEAVTVATDPDALVVADATDVLTTAGVDDDSAAEDSLDVEGELDVEDAPDAAPSTLLAALTFETATKVAPTGLR